METIAEAGEVSSSDIVLEVGPGKGSLTELLARKAKKVIAVEKDPELVDFLKKKFHNHRNIEIISGDILKITTPYALLSTPYKVVANVPYYITSRFLKIFLTLRHKPQTMVLMVQHEVAKRITTRPGEMNLLALSVQAFGNPKIVAKVSRRYFHPRPKVDSAIIKVSDISDKWLKDNGLSEETFFFFPKKAFQQKRKMLSRSLGIQNLPARYQSARPQDLSLDDWAQIAQQFS